LVPFDEPPAGFIDQAAAIAVAESRFGRGTFETTAEPGTISDDTKFSRNRLTGEITYRAQDRPVWLVHLNGYATPNFGPGAKDGSRRPAAQELNVVIDGHTGEYLFSYSHR
jgi:hypothetical protein